MMIKHVACDKVVEKRKKWAIFEELTDKNETLDEAICILDNLKDLITQLPDKLSSSSEQAVSLMDSVMNLDSFLDKCMESTSMYFDEIETKLDKMQKSLLHDEVSNWLSFSKLASEVRGFQKLIDGLISNAEEEIYRFLESEGLFGERRKTDSRIMELVLNFY